MSNDILSPIIRRAILDLLFDVGGEYNDDVLTMLLNQLGHTVARRDVAQALVWLAGNALIATDELGPYTVARIRPDGRDVAQGRLRIAGVSRFKTGE